METKMKVMGEMPWVKLKIKLSTANAENCRPIQADTIGHDENLLPSCFGSFWYFLFWQNHLLKILVTSGGYSTAKTSPDDCVGDELDRM